MDLAQLLEAAPTDPDGLGLAALLLREPRTDAVAALLEPDPEIAAWWESPVECASAVAITWAGTPPSEGAELVPLDERLAEAAALEGFRALPAT